MLYFVLFYLICHSWYRVNPERHVKLCSCYGFQFGKIKIEGLFKFYMIGIVTIFFPQKNHKSMPLKSLGMFQLSQGWKLLNRQSNF